LVGELEEKKPLGRPRRRWKDNIKVDLGEIGCGIVDWIRMTQDRIGGGLLTVMILNVVVDKAVTN
jgi:hypothetical protein